MDKPTLWLTKRGTFIRASFPYEYAQRRIIVMINLSQRNERIYTVDAAAFIRNASVLVFMLTSRGWKAEWPSAGKKVTQTLTLGQAGNLTWDLWVRRRLGRCSLRKPLHAYERWALELILSPDYPFMWHTEEWDECSYDCGPGTQTRDVSCVNQDDGRKVSNDKCSKTKVPPKERKCYGKKCGKTGIDASISNRIHCSCHFFIACRCTRIKFPLAEMSSRDISTQSKPWDEMSPSWLRTKKNWATPSKRRELVCKSRIRSFI